MIDKASLALELQALQLPLRGVLSNGPSPGTRAERERVSVRVAGPASGGAGVGPEKIRALALTEILRIAAGGEVTLQLPLVPRSYRAGPFSIDIVAGMQVVIMLHVADGNVDLEKTHGRIEPPIALPLGIGFNGVRLGRDGSIIAQLSRFPDINLSDLALGGLRIPARLGDMLDVIFPPDAAKAEGEEKKPPPVDVRGLVVHAEHVVPRAEPVVLGENTRVSLGPETRLAIDWGGQVLQLAGPVVIPDAQVGGTGFTVAGVRGRAQARLRIDFGGEHADLEMEMEGVTAEMDRAEVALPDGSRLDFQGLRIADARMSITRRAGVTTTRLQATGVEGTLASGVLQVHVDQRPLPLQVGPVSVRGEVDVDGSNVALRLDVTDARVAATDAALSLGVLDLHLESLEASGAGEVRYSREAGFSFRGRADLVARADAGTAGVARVQARVAPGSALKLAMDEVRVHDGQVGLGARATLDLVFAGGSIPVTSTASLVFRDGARGHVELRELRLLPGNPLPVLQGALSLHASSEPMDLGGGLTFPAGHADVRVDDVRVDEGGILHVATATIRVDTGDGA